MRELQRKDSVILNAITQLENCGLVSEGQLKVQENLWQEKGVLIEVDSWLSRDQRKRV